MGLQVILVVTNMLQQYRLIFVVIYLSETDFQLKTKRMSQYNPFSAYLAQVKIFSLDNRGDK